MILLEVSILERGMNIGEKLGDPQPYKAGAAGPEQNDSRPAAVNGHGGKRFCWGRGSIAIGLVLCFLFL